MAEVRWYSVKEIAELLKVNPETVRRWLRSRQLSAIALKGKGGYRVSKSDLDAFLKRLKAKGPK